jgi:hypothetical protein
MLSDKWIGVEAPVVGVLAGLLVEALLFRYRTDCYSNIMSLYRFSPIADHEALIKAIDYIAFNATKLYFDQTGNYPNDLIRSLTVFAHFDDEFDLLVDLTKQLGTVDSEHNGPYIKLTAPLSIENGRFELNGKMHTVHTKIEMIRIRKPDPYRMQVGCCDLEVPFDSPDLEDVKLSLNQNSSPRYIDRPDLKMLELFDPNIDVLAYIIK